MLSTWIISVTLSDNGQNQWDGSLCDVLQIVVWTFVLFSLAIVLSVHLLFTDSDFPFGIFELFSIH
jgi:hypothetical protein